MKGSEGLLTALKVLKTSLEVIKCFERLRKVLELVKVLKGPKTFKSLETSKKVLKVLVRIR